MTDHAVTVARSRRTRHPRRAALSGIVAALALAGTVAALAAPALSAQTPETTPDTIPQGTKVGSVPNQSPYHDLQTPQRFTVFGGYFAASRDVAHATPGSGPLVGAQYEVTVGGPAQFYVRAARVWSNRSAYDPALSASARGLGSISSPLYLADLGFSFDLTGRKSWHSLVPIVGFGIGVASAGGTTAKDPYRFGTQFQATTELGMRYIPHNGVEARITLGNAFYQTHYPSAYYTKASDGTSVVPQSEGRSAFRANWMFTGGLSVPIFR